MTDDTQAARETPRSGSDLVSDIAREAFAEAARRYTSEEAQRAIVFLEVALGYATIAPDDDDITWARKQIAEIEAAAIRERGDA